MGSKLWPQKARGSCQRGMSLVELLVAMAVLAVGMGGMVAVFAAAIAGNGKAKFDTEGTMLAQEVLERIAAQPQVQAGFPAPPPITMTDCNPAGAFPWTIATTPGVPAGGAQLDPNSNIDWNGQTNANVPLNYKMLYVVCGNNGRQVTYDVRWNVQAISANSRMITVGARPLAAAGGGIPKFTQPITLRTVGGL
jgi:type IV pilus modification protein PilV